MKTIGYYEALDILERCQSKVTMPVLGPCKACMIPEEFTLIAVPGGSNGAQGMAGDWILLHPDGYPMIMTSNVAWEHIPHGQNTR